MGLPEIIIADAPLLVAGMLITMAAIALCRGVARRRIIDDNRIATRDAGRNRLEHRSIPHELAAVHARLRNLAGEMNDALPRQIRLIDQWIDDCDREIARLQRRLASSGSASHTMNRREPDVLSIGDFERQRIVPTDVPHVERSPARRAA